MRREPGGCGASRADAARAGRMRRAGLRGVVDHRLYPVGVQVTWLEFHRPQFGESRFAIAVLNLMLVYTALAWVLVLIPEEPSLLSVAPLTDATVVERTGEQAVLRVSHPTQEQMCAMSRAEFGGDLPEVGAVVPVDYNGTTCALPAWSDTAPSLAMRISAILGTVILAGWTFRAFTRPRTNASRTNASRNNASRNNASRNNASRNNASENNASRNSGSENGGPQNGGPQNRGPQNGGSQTPAAADRSRAKARRRRKRRLKR
jgi:hypothetical protein